MNHTNSIEVVTCLGCLFIEENKEDHFTCKLNGEVIENVAVCVDKNCPLTIHDVIVKLSNKAVLTE